MLNLLIDSLTSHAHAEQARAMQAYLKGHFPFLGIKSPARRQLSRPWIQAVKQTHKTVPQELIEQLWELPEREYQYVALDLLDAYERKMDAAHLPMVEAIILKKAWWDTVDLLASHQVGSIFRTQPSAIDEWTDKWMASNHLWLQRCCLLYQLKYKTDTDWERLQGFVIQLMLSDEFFLQKAIGWALRQYAKVAPEAVRHFVDRHPLAPLSRREALRHL